MYLSQKKDISEGHYPFLLERKPDQVVTVELHQTQEQDLEFILSFVKLEQQYPIYKFGRKTTMLLGSWM
jgi:hypothetical protein